jgi:hypothetical protein
MQARQLWVLVRNKDELEADFRSADLSGYGSLKDNADNEILLE